MNVKLRMPKFNQNLDKSSMMKELLMTFIGTTLSIVLTFGTADYIDKKEKKNLGRQTAMMVIHDMDNTVELLKEFGKEEKNGIEMARYVRRNGRDNPKLQRPLQIHHWYYTGSKQERVGYLQKSH